MSLINEALKKARLESARREDRRLGVLTPSYVPHRRSIWPWVVTAISLSLAAGVVVGVLLLRGGSQASEPAAADPSPTASAQVLVTPSSPPVEEPRAEAIEIPEALAEAEVPAPLDREDVVSEAAPNRPEPSVEEDPALPEPEIPPSAVPSEEAEAAPAVPLDEPSEESEVSPAVPAGPKDGESFLRRVPLAGGEELVLNGIAWSDSGPVALLNGRALEQGEYVEGWKVESIERQKVELAKGDVTVRVRLK